MDNIQLVITEIFKHVCEGACKACIQQKTDKWIQQKLEREDSAADKVNSGENTG